MDKPQKVGWETGGSVQKERIPYVPQARNSEKSSNSEKEGNRVWNLMRKTLLDNDLMESKEDKD